VVCPVGSGQRRRRPRTTNVAVTPRPLLPVILAAGMGSRLGGRPKALFPVGGRPLLDLCVEALAAGGFSGALVVTGHRADEVRRHASAARYPLECVFVHNDRYSDLNNFHSVRVAAEMADAHNLLILNCDVVFRQEVLTTAAGLSTASLGLLVELGIGDAEAMKVELDDGIVRRLGKNIPPEAAFGEFIGISTLAPAAQAAYVDAADEAVRAGEHNLYYEDIYSRICQRVVVRVSGVESGSWAEVDTPADISAATQVAAARRNVSTGGHERFGALAAVGAR
jgi:L-glutamine-phosphate cytidylyltransferase